MATPVLPSNVNQQSAYRSPFVDISGNPTAFGLGTNTDVLRVSAGTIAPGQTIQNYSTGGGIAVNTTTSVRTVTTGKTWYITDICMTASTSTACLVQIKGGGTVYFEAYVSSSAPVNFAGIESQDGIPSTTAVTIVTANTGSSSFTVKIAGIEQ